MAERLKRGITIEGLRKRYGSGETAVDALKGVDMAVSPGEVVGLIGPSGSGKSTLLKCMAGLITPQGGTITVNGRQIAGMPEREMLTVRAELGFVFQYSALFDSLTVAENISLAPVRRFGWSRAKARDMVKSSKPGLS